MVEAMVVRFDDHTLRIKFVERIDGLFDGHLYIGQRCHCEQTEAPGMRLSQPGPFFIHSARELFGLKIIAKVYARRRDGQHSSVNLQLVHHGESGFFAPLRYRRHTIGMRLPGLYQRVVVEIWQKMCMNINTSEPHGTSLSARVAELLD
jgi:hypothetical protein